MKTVEITKPLRFEEFSFGSIRIDGVTYERDVVIDRGEVRKRKKKPSKKFREAFGHTPLSAEEKIPWKCKRLVIGTGTGALPIMDDMSVAVVGRQEAPPLNCAASRFHSVVLGRAVNFFV